MNPTRTKSLLLSSRLRKYKTDTPTNFTCHLDNTVDMSDVKRVVLKSVHIMNAFPNVDVHNNKFYFTVAGAHFVVTIPVGSYNASDFLDNLTYAINSSGPTICTGASYNATSYRASLTCTTPFAALSLHDVSENYSNVYDSLNFIIGAHPFTTAAETLSQTYDGIINLTGVSHVHIESTALASGHSADSTGHVRNVIAVVPVTSNFGATSHWAPNNHMLSMVDFATDRAINTIDIRITDRTGQVLTLPSNAEVSLELMIVFDSF